MISRDVVNETLREMGRSLATAYRNRAVSENHTGTQRIDNESLIPEFKVRNWPVDMVGCSVRDEDQVWVLLQPYNGNTYPQKPKDMRAQWGLCHTTDPKKAKPYVPSVGTSGLYMMDECCIWIDGNVYRSKGDNNAYSPDDYTQGWDKL